MSEVRLTAHLLSDGLPIAASGRIACSPRNQGEFDGNGF